MHTISELGLCIRQRRIFDIDGQGRDRALSGDQSKLGHLASMPGVGAPNPKFSRVEMVPASDCFEL